MLVLEYVNDLRCVYQQRRVTFESLIFVHFYNKIITQDPLQYILTTVSTIFGFTSEMIGRFAYPVNARKNNYTCSCKLSVLFLLAERKLEIE